MGVFAFKNPMFSVLVAGGAALGIGSSMSRGDDDDTNQRTCRTELHSLTYDMQPRVQCLDNVTTDEEILRIVRAAQNPQCASPNCHCWLG